jgi:hypothetical protein
MESEEVGAKAAGFAGGLCDSAQQLLSTHVYRPAAKHLADACQPAAELSIDARRPAAELSIDACRPGAEQRYTKRIRSRPEEKE